MNKLNVCIYMGQIITHYQCPHTSPIIFSDIYNHDLFTVVLKELV